MIFIEKVFTECFDTADAAWTLQYTNNIHLVKYDDASTCMECENVCPYKNEL